MGTLTHYTREQKLEAATHYAVHGSLAKLERDLNIPRSTSCTWKKNDEIWVEQVEQVRMEKADKHIALYHRLTKKALKLANEGIDELDGKTLTASDIKALVVTGATATDKSLLLDGKPTSIRADSKSMQTMIDRFERIERDHQAGRGRVVSVQDQEK